jgi:hypothetical protein
VTEISPERAAIDFGSRWRRVILKICLTLLFYGFMSVLLFPSVSPASEQYMLNAPELKQAVEVPVNFSGGEGSASDPYLISSAEDLAALSNRVSGEETEMARYAASHYMQTADIDISPLETWNPIGESREKPFAGVYDGGGHKIRHIRNLTIEDKEGHAMEYLEYGLFGVVSGDSDLRELGIVRNIQMESSLSFFLSLRENRTLGTISGLMLGGKLQNCSNNGAGITIHIKVPAKFSRNPFPIIGGLIGQAEDSVIDDCVNKARIYVSPENESPSFNSWRVGGVVGNAKKKLALKNSNEPLINRCQNYGSIEIPEGGFNRIGGIAGFSDVAITDCRNFGSISVVGSDLDCGGISGPQGGGMVLRCFNAGYIQIKNIHNARGKIRIGGIV